VVAPHGRVAFFTPDDGGDPARKGKVFPLQSEQPRNFLPESKGGKIEKPKATSFRNR
jgi:hypothetical protein